MILVDFPSIVYVTEALKGWPVEETTWKVGSCMDEESSSSSFGFPKRFSHAPTLTKSSLGLKPLRSLGWMPSYVRASFSSLGPQFVVGTNGGRGVINSIYRPEIHISEGLRFPFLPLMHQFLQFTRLHPVHIHMNIVRVLLGVSMLNRKHGLYLGLEEVLYTYPFKRHNLGKYYFVANAKSLQLVTNLPNTNNKP